LDHREEPIVVEIAPLDGPGDVQRRAYIAVSLSQIVLAMPADSARSED
jgi:hypothetical protein